MQANFVLSQLANKRHGFFIDSGAAMGIQGNNTYLLETQYEWSGLCVEPVPEFFADLKKTRRCHLYEGALSDLDGKAALVIPSNPWLTGLKDKLGHDVWSEVRAQATREIEVSTFRIETLLDKIQAPRLIDYWSLDTEGSEYMLLKTFPWSRYTVTLLTIEHNQETSKQTAISDFLSEDYTEVKLTDNESGFIKKIKA
jgi:FkbM family methyltransferase